MIADEASICEVTQVRRLMGRCDEWSEKGKRSSPLTSYNALSDEDGHVEWRTRFMLKPDAAESSAKMRMAGRRGAMQ